MPDDDIRKSYEAGGFRPRLVHSSEDQSTGKDAPFGLRPLQILDQKTIPHRRWLYGTQLIRGFVTLLIAPGGTGKSSLILAMCMALATRRALLGARIHQRCNAGYLNLEDPQDEVDRRVTALAMRYGITNTDIEGRLFTSEPDRGVKIAAAGADGFSVVRRVARLGDCAVLLAHHVRKGTVDSIEAARGAKALTDSARVGLLLSTMNVEDAKALGVSSEERLQYARLDDAKANMAARAPKATWFHLDHVTLDNADEIYPNGDQVVVIEPWEPPNAWDSMSEPDCNVALDRIAAGLPGGLLYTDTRKGQTARWAGDVLVELFDITEDQAADVIKTWLKNGVLVQGTFSCAATHYKPVRGLKVNDTKRPGSR
jgi:hypothetical protein